MAQPQFIDQVFDSRIGRNEASGDAVDRDRPTFYIVFPYFLIKPVLSQ